MTDDSTATPSTPPAPPRKPLCLQKTELSQVAGYLKQNHFFWLDMQEPTPDEIKQLGDLLSLHPLTLDDVSTFSERPKREHYDGYVSMVVYGVDENADIGASLLREVHLIISGAYVVSLHPIPFDVLDKLRTKLLDEGVRGEQALVYQIIDTVLATYVPVLSKIDDSIDDIEQSVIQSPKEESLQQIFSLKRDLIGMRRVVTPMRDFFARDEDEIAHLPGMEADDTLYLRDLYDGLVRTSDLIDSYRDLLSGATDMYLSTVANRQGEISKQLTIIATIFLPLSFLTGFFGQNFAWLVNNVLRTDVVVLRSRSRAPGLSILVLVIWFKRRGWLDPD